MTSLVLHEFHQHLGARFVSVNGIECVGNYGDVASEFRALTEGAGVLDLSARGRLVLLGADRQKLLNGQVTNNVRDLQPGQGCYAALVNAKAKMLADLNVFVLPSELILDLEPGLAGGIAERLEKFVVADDVQIVDAAPHYGLLSVQGRHAARVVEQLEWFPTLPTEPLAHVAVNDPTLGEIYLANHARLGHRGFDLFVPNAALGAVADRLAAAAREFGGRLCGLDAFEIVRIEAGIPRYGVDMDETNLPPECGIGERAISYTKGCYSGQEVIARIRTYGQVAKALRGLRLSGGWESATVNEALTPDPSPVQTGEGGDAERRQVRESPLGLSSSEAGINGSSSLPVRGTRLFKDDREVGVVTSATHSPRVGGPIALGYVRRECNGPGVELSVGAPGSAVRATIVPLPFVGLQFA